MKTLRLIGVGLLTVLLCFSSCSDEEDGGVGSYNPFVGVWTTESYNNEMQLPSEHIIEFKSDGTYNVISRIGPSSGTWNYDENTRMLVTTTPNRSVTWIVTNITSNMFALMSIDNTNTYVYNRTEKNSGTNSNPTNDTEKFKRIKEQIEKNVSFTANYNEGAWYFTINTNLNKTIEDETVKYGIMSGNNQGESFYNGKYYEESEFCYNNMVLTVQPGNNKFVQSPWNGSRYYSELYADWASTYGKIMDIQERMKNGEPVSDEEREWYYDNLDFCNDLSEELQELAEDVYWAEVYVQVGDHKFVIGNFGETRNYKWSGREEDLYYTKWKPKTNNAYTFEFTGNDYGYKFYYGGNFSGYWSCKNGILNWEGSYLGAGPSGAFSQKFRRGGEIVMYSRKTLIVSITETNELIEFERV